MTLNWVLNPNLNKPYPRFLWFSSYDITKPLLYSRLTVAPFVTQPVVFLWITHSFLLYESELLCPVSFCITPWKIKKVNLHLHYPVEKGKSDFKAGASARREKRVKKGHTLCSFSLCNSSQLVSNPVFPVYISVFTLLLNENFAKCFILTLASLLYCSFKLCFVFLLIAFFCIQEVLWWEDWNLFCLARILHWDVIPCSSCWLNLFSLWLVYNGWKYEQVSIMLKISWAYNGKS